MFKLYEIYTSICLLFATWFSLNAIGYFASSWVLILTVLVGLVTRWLPTAGWLLYSLLVFLALAYHDATFAIAWLAIALLCLKQLDASEIAIPEPLLILTVFFAALNPFDQPIEWVAFWFIGAFFPYRSVFPVLVAGQLSVLIGGLFVHTNQFGHFLMGSSSMPAIILGKLSSTPFSLQWVFQKIQTFKSDRLLQSFQSAADYLLHHPLTLLQIGFIAGTMSFFAHCRQKREETGRLFWVIFGGLISVFLVSASSELNTFEITESFSIASVWVGCAQNAILFLIFVIVREFALRQSHQKAATKMTSHRKMPTVPEHQKPLDTMSLSDTLEMKIKLQEHLQKKFKKTVAALDIDIAGSTLMKQNADQEDIIVSFNAYAKYIDHHCQANQGKLINRSGDGAMYIFPSSDNASRAGEMILRGLGHFNENKNMIGQPFNVRIGIHSGEIIADDSSIGKEDVYSFVLDITGHLQKNGPENQICISEQAYNELSDQSIYKEVGFLKSDNIHYKISEPIF